LNALELQDLLEAELRSWVGERSGKKE
jgi:hypothetical protein